MKKRRYADRSGKFPTKSKEQKKEKKSGKEHSQRKDVTRIPKQNKTYKAYRKRDVGRQRKRKT
jgi:hypothetical protein